MRYSLRSLLGALVIAAIAPLAVAAAEDERYGYVRTLDGNATITSENGERQAAQANQPVLDGDLVEVASGSRVDIELADRNLVRLDEGTSLALERLAFSADSSARSTQLRLDTGDLQLLVTEETLGDTLPRIDTSNATLYVSQPGLFRVTAERDWTQISVRSGSLEVRTPTESHDLAAGEGLRIQGAEWPTVSRFDAQVEDDFDLWGRELDAQVEQADLRYVEPEMRYSASSLSQYGDWVNVGSRHAWRPSSVGSDWRPYQDGRWGYNPSGLTWISNEPWGWSTYHYGSWDQVPSYGWVWYPGYVYSPAWVYWYWGPSYAAWCPSGYYGGYGHNGYGGGYRHGVYGWAGGGWGAFADWNFLPTRYLGHRDQRRYSHPGSYYRDHQGLREVPRGIITTDTRPITPERWDRPEEVMELLRRTPIDTRPGGRTVAGDLPDVTGFVHRRDEITPEARERLASLPPATDVAVARRVPRDRGGATEPRGGLRSISQSRASGTTAVVPRASRPAEPTTTTDAQPRAREARPTAVVPREGGAVPNERLERSRPQRPRDEGDQPAADGMRTTVRPRPSSPTVESHREEKPRTVVREREAPPQMRSVTSPRSGPDPGRQGWKSNQPPSGGPHTISSPRSRPAMPGGDVRRYEAPRRVEAPPQTRSYSAPRRVETPPQARRYEVRQGQPPAVRRVIDGVRSSRPAATPPGAQAQPRAERERYATPPQRDSGTSSAQPRARGSSKESSGGRGKSSTERKPPKRDRDR